jgi:hypothetical protein
MVEENDFVLAVAYINVQIYMLRCNYHNSGHYSSFCILFKTQRFGDWILSPKRCMLNKIQDDG